MGSLLARTFVFLGALLLFTVEPLCGRLLLPDFGGSFHVWATCLAFFQGALFLGYLYCHLLAPRIGRAGHLLLLLLPLAVLPLQLDHQADLRAPIASISRTLARGVGLPFLALATTAVIAQAWVARSALPERRDPYPLYAASNLGSLLGLLAYPLLLEPLLPLRAQRLAWSLAYVLYVALGLALARACAPVPAASEPAPAAPAQGAPPVPAWAWIYWLLLSAGPSALLIAATNVITLDVGSVPLLWTAPLAAYLLTFVLVFRERPWYPRALAGTWFHVALGGLALYLAGRMRGQHGTGALAIAGHLAILFVVSLAAHHELHRARPPAARLTGYYLTMSLGGWLGGLFVSHLAPVLFDGLTEYPLAIAAIVLTLAVGRRDALRAWLAEAPRPLVGGSLLLGALALAVVLLSIPSPPLFVRRNFYGIYAVDDLQGANGDVVRVLFHGTTLHGLEVRNRRAGPLGYYGPRSPLPEVLDALPRPRRVAILGLGAGAMLPHFQAGERVTVYELDPDNEGIAEEWFGYLRGCPARVNVVVGDARIALAADAADGSLDLLVADAFSSDSVPVHLATREALELYLQKLQPRGAMVLHISNRFLDLRPTLMATAAGVPSLQAAWKAQLQPGRLDQGEYEFGSMWLVASRDAALLQRLRAQGWSQEAAPASPWTDDFASPLGPLWHRLGREW